MHRIFIFWLFLLVASCDLGLSEPLEETKFPNPYESPWNIVALGNRQGLGITLPAMARKVKDPICEANETSPGSGKWIGYVREMGAYKRVCVVHQASLLWYDPLYQTFTSIWMSLSSGQIGIVTTQTQADVRAHEGRHVTIRQYVVAKYNDYINGKFSEIKTKEHNSEDEAISAAEQLADQFLLACRVHAADDANIYSDMLDNCENAGVDAGGVWRLQANPGGLSDIFSQVDKITINLPVPTEP